MISIGAVYRGPELQGSAINNSIMAVSQALRGFRGPLKEGKTPWVNAVFIVPGSLGVPGFEGMEYGKFSKKNMGVVVQIAVPVDVIKSGNHLTFLIKALRDTNSLSYKFFKKKGMEFPVAEADAMVDKAADKLKSGE